MTTCDFRGVTYPRPAARPNEIYLSEALARFGDQVSTVLSTSHYYFDNDTLNIFANKFKVAEGKEYITSISVSHSRDHPAGDSKWMVDMCKVDHVKKLLNERGYPPVLEYDEDDADDATSQSD